MTEITDRRQKDGKYRRWIELDPKQAAVWRYAWDLLLSEVKSLSDICEALHTKGYTLRAGTPFVRIKNGRRIRNKAALSRVFRNPFYAGVIDFTLEDGTRMQIQGEWEPMVSLEDFARGCAILDEHDRKRNHQRINIYLLGSGLLKLEYEDGTQIPLTCATPNRNRERGGSAPQYCDHNYPPYFLCREIDPQVNDHLHKIQIKPSWVSELSHLFEKEIKEKLQPTSTEDRRALEARLKELNREEDFLVRQARKQKISELVYEDNMAEVIDQRNKINQALTAETHDVKHYVDGLNAALALLSKIGILFEKLDLQNQHRLLRNLADQVIINPAGVLNRIELNPPFSYIQSRLGGGENGLTGRHAQYSDGINAESAHGALGGSNKVAFSGPSRI